MKESEMIKVLQAYMEGKKIQFRFISTDKCIRYDWKDIDSKVPVNWDFGRFEYRVKQVYPFTNKVEALSAIQEHGDWLSYQGEYHKVFGLSDEGFSINDGYHHYADNPGDFTFIDGTPFGLVDDEK